MTSTFKLRFSKRRRFSLHVRQKEKPVIQIRDLSKSINTTLENLASRGNRVFWKSIRIVHVIQWNKRYANRKPMQNCWWKFLFCWKRIFGLIIFVLGKTLQSCRLPQKELISIRIVKAILQVHIYKALYDKSYLGSKTTMTSGEWTCLISFATAPLTCSERGESEKFKMKIYVSSGIRTHTPPVHDRKVAAP